MLVCCTESFTMRWLSSRLHANYIILSGKSKSVFANSCSEHRTRTIRIRSYDVLQSMEKIDWNKRQMKRKTPLTPIRKSCKATEATTTKTSSHRINAVAEVSVHFVWLHQYAHCSDYHFRTNEKAMLVLLILFQMFRTILIDSIETFALSSVQAFLWISMNIFLLVKLKMFDKSGVIIFYSTFVAFFYVFCRYMIHLDEFCCSFHV